MMCMVVVYYSNFTDVSVRCSLVPRRPGNEASFIVLSLAIHTAAASEQLSVKEAKKFLVRYLVSQRSFGSMQSMMNARVLSELLPLNLRAMNL